MQASLGKVFVLLRVLISGTKRKGHIYLSSKPRIHCKKTDFPAYQIQAVASVSQVGQQIGPLWVHLLWNVLYIFF